MIAMSVSTVLRKLALKETHKKLKMIYILTHVYNIMQYMVLYAIRVIWVWFVQIPTACDKPLISDLMPHVCLLTKNNA